VPSAKAKAPKGAAYGPPYSGQFKGTGLREIKDFLQAFTPPKNQPFRHQLGGSVNATLGRVYIGIWAVIFYKNHGPNPKLRL